MTLKVRVPILSSDNEKAHIGKVFVEAGQQVKCGDSLCSVETDKVIFELAAYVDGVVEKIFTKEGDYKKEYAALMSITPLTELSTDEKEELQSSDVAIPFTSALECVVTHALKEQGNIDIVAPDLSELGRNFLNIYVKEGSTVEQGDLLCDIETDDEVFDIYANHSGVICKFNKMPNDTICSGELLVTMYQEPKKTVDTTKEQVQKPQGITDSPQEPKSRSIEEICADANLQVELDAQSNNPEQASFEETAKDLISQERSELPDILSEVSTTQSCTDTEVTTNTPQASSSVKPFLCGMLFATGLFALFTYLY
ncbi:biotin/lipoyl-containing protein [Pseudoalteromonas umbrosa]|uniref:biotin/lipoyl-containing protein n=1 Tax=Pseudoalteromonas umbrosa TaxID=3048489 RepID=UPI0024C2DB99|nr:biotin/lipoyl-containing protein [Pseudoalteromonas sp. B95]MDK1288423.1 biotin/lipoyl-containing protein [Pseudoalteromonas sp. B95]